MDQLIPAVFNSGVFRPLQPVELAEGTQVQVQVPHFAEAPSAELSPEALARQQAAITEFLETMEALPDEAEETRKAWNDYLDRMESLPSVSPQDGLTNRDHDRIIYGG